jgi:response regulator RpfG family c-di-GMP phosphodiesterase
MRKHILIVDDEQLFREICQEMLGERGYRVSVAEDVPSGLAVLQAERVDLLVVDITLPGVDGLTMIEQVRQTQPDIPAIVITGFLTQENMLRSLNLGVRGFLTKPFFYDELFQAVDRALGDTAATRNQLLLDHYLPLIRLGEEILIQDKNSLFSRTLSTALEIALMQTGATQGFIAVPEAGGATELAAASGFSPEEQPRLNQYLKQVQAAIEAVPHDPTSNEPQDLVQHGLISTMDTLVVRLPGVSPTGLLVLARPNGDNDFTVEERKLAHLLAVQAAIAINQDIALRREDAGSEASTLNDLASALVPTDSSLDRATRADLASLAAELAHTLGCDSATRQAVINAVLFHDLGKAFVPSAVLGKHGPLSDEEWTDMRPYVTLGAERLSRAGSLAAAAPLVAAHRERYDGTGYPQGRGGDDIPIQAYIVSAVTSWGAMRSPRPYRDALPVSIAREEMRGGSGRAYHPKVVDALLDATGQ